MDRQPKRLPAAARAAAPELNARAATVKLRTTAGVPLYVQLRELLREQIRRGDWAPTEPLPTEQILSEHHGVSRSTVRQAVTDLVRDGLVTRQAGKGTFPRQANLVLRMQGYLSVHQDMIQRGVRPSRRVLDAQVLKLTPELTRKGLAPLGPRLIRIQELRLGDGVPVMVFEHHYPADLCAFLLGAPLDDPDVSLYGLMRQQGIDNARAVGELHAVIVSDVEADVLELERGSPAIEITTQTYNSQERLVEVARAVVRSDRYALVLASEWSG
jgi:GntR family transcriptional regulator